MKTRGIALGCIEFRHEGRYTQGQARVLKEHRGIVS
jgi:hypothetical protein